VLVREGDLRGRRVLEVGCGTGVLAAALAEREAARVWAVDAEPAMLEIARGRMPKGAGVREGRAEELPFRDGWFERVVLRLVIHLVDRTRALPELRRVLAPDGRAAIATFDHSHLDGWWLAPIFPEMVDIDRVRLPEPGTLCAELEAAGFRRTRVVRLTQRRTMDRESALEKIRGRHISTFDFLSEDALAAGLERAERTLPPQVDNVIEWAIVIADR
jgi:ubiquinone/menaquinone biosynthesis C-methylase UbiE